MTIHKETLVYDLETAGVGSKPNPEKDRLRVFGCYSYLTEKYYVITNKDQMRKLIEKHKYIVGFNTMQFDNCIMYNNGFFDMLRGNDYGDYRFKGKIDIDLLQIIKTRVGIIKIKKGFLNNILMDFKLDSITRVLDLVDDSNAKDTLDYNILKKEHWTPEEANFIRNTFIGLNYGKVFPRFINIWR